MSKTNKVMLYIGTTASCSSYIELVEDSDLSAEEIGTLRAAATVLKSRPMKTLRDFQKPKYGTAPTILGLHGTCTMLPMENHDDELMMMN